MTGTGYKDIIKETVHLAFGDKTLHKQQFMPLHRRSMLVKPPLICAT
jgi:hypothetical protein